ncbi:MAG: tyrosine-type recombinase/integrase [Acidobacteria bacterium]|nr:tyrosine-type recombinase/integrase [Acidobacteriota bacterium]
MISPVCGWFGRRSVEIVTPAGAVTARSGPRLQNQGLVFCPEDGNPLHPNLFSQMLVRTVVRAGVLRIRLHDLRHTHATLALKAGIPVKVISERLGHRDPAFALRQYAHALPGMQAEAATQIAALMDHPDPNRAGPRTSMLDTE